MASRAAERSRLLAAEERTLDPHVTHHQHLKGTGVDCSCGEFLGIICVAFGEDYDPDKLFCSVCGQRGVVHIGS